jgi:hypothetical protein
VRSVPVTGLSWISAFCAPRPAATCRSTALVQVLSIAPGNHAGRSGSLSFQTARGRRTHSMSSAARAQNARGSASDSA